MRSLIDKKVQGSKQKKKNTFLTILILILLLLSTLGYAFLNTDSSQDSSKISIKFNGYDFYNQENIWVLPIQGLNFFFYNHPSQLNLSHLNNNSQIKSIDNYVGKPLYFSSVDPSSYSLLYSNLFSPNSISSRIQEACFSDCELDLPVKNCQDNFIIIIESNESSITQDQNCVWIKGNKNELSSLTQEYFLRILGVI